MGYNTQEFNKERKDDFVGKNFLLVSLEEKKAQKIAEVISNDTARKILDALAKKDYTESDLSKDLNIPISTVHYNLKQLQDAQLVTVEEFHYSEKGKEVNHYTLANKYIIIAPKGENSKFIEALRKVLPVAVITAVVGGVMTVLNMFIGSKSAVLSKAVLTDAAPRVMTAGSEASVQLAMQAAPPNTSLAATTTVEVARPLMQSSSISWFLIGALAILIIYFLYEWTRKR